jgi:hypothetical protein
MSPWSVGYVPIVNDGCDKSKEMYLAVLANGVAISPSRGGCTVHGDLVAGRAEDVANLLVEADGDCHDDFLSCQLDFLTSQLSHTVVTPVKFIFGVSV